MKKQYTENYENLLLSKKCPGVSGDIYPYNVCVMLMGHNQIVKNDHMPHDVSSDRLLTQSRDKMPLYFKTITLQ